MNSTRQVASPTPTLLPLFTVCLLFVDRSRRYVTGFEVVPPSALIGVEDEPLLESSLLLRFLDASFFHSHRLLRAFYLLSARCFCLSLSSFFSALVSATFFIAFHHDAAPRSSSFESELNLECCSRQSKKKKKHPLPFNQPTTSSLLSQPHNLSRRPFMKSKTHALAALFLRHPTIHARACYQAA